MENRNLLIVGRINCGKSVLANVITGTEYFQESESIVRDTDIFRKKDFSSKEMKYHVIDARVKPTEIYNKIEKIIRLVPEGISQILYVVDERFSAEEIKTFELYEKAIIQSKIFEYTTIVRTKFFNFKSTAECEKDKQDFCDESKKIANIINKCKIVYVDNPPTNIVKPSDSDDYETIENNNKRRKKSRGILLNHLEVVCHQGEDYKLKIWDDNRLLDRIAKSEGLISKDLTREIKRSLEGSGVSEFVKAVKKDKKEKKSLLDFFKKNKVDKKKN